MKQRRQPKSMVKALVNVLNASLLVDANSTSCTYFHQPKAPEELSRFRRSK